MNLKVAIIEDEIPAAEKLVILLKKYDPEITIVGKAGSIETSIKLLNEYQDEIDLLFMDIQLTDGLSFDIFEHINYNKALVFITAFDHYALDAFRANAIDYLLKPITYKSLSDCLAKIDSLRANLGKESIDLKTMLHVIQSKKTYKDRFMVKVGDKIYSITADNIELIFAEGRDAYVITKENKKYIIDHTLESLEDTMNPTQFFRINRSCIVPINSIENVLVYSNSRLKITLLHFHQKELIVSREKVSSFKAWYDGSI